MYDDDRAFLFDLLSTPSPSGFEAAGQRVWAGYMRAYADTVETDHYGNAWAVLGSMASPRLMLEAHADEIGFMINHVSDEGFLYVVRIGGSDGAIARGRRVQVLGNKGPVAGVIGNTAIHIRDRKDEKVAEIHELFIDIGAANQDEVAARGLRVGHPVVFAESVEEVMPGRLTGRALDNRMGGYIIAQVMARLTRAEQPLQAQVVAVNAVQEEIGGHGAQMVTYRLQPTVAVVLDVAHATDSPGISKEKHGKVKLGGGPTVTHGTANHPLVVERLMAVAEAQDIPLQHTSSSRYTGTDTDQVFRSRSGVPSALVSLPMRYMHSTIETVALDDVEACIRLLTAFAQSLTPDDAFRADL